MLFVSVRAVRWFGMEPQPGLVEVVLTDVRGTEWRFVDKAPIFGGDLHADSPYPLDLLIGCTEIGRRGSPDGDVVTISTAEPWGIETEDGVSRFDVPGDQLSE